MYKKKIAIMLCLTGIAASALGTAENTIKLDMNSKSWSGPKRNVKDDDTLCLKVKPGAYLTAKPFFEVNKDKAYSFSITTKSVGEKHPLMLFGIMCYDADKKIISTTAVNTVANTATTLAANAKAGSDSVIIENGKKWKAGGFIAFEADHSGKFNDLPNRNISSKITKITSKDNQFILTLQKPIKKSYPAGTKIRLHKAGNSYLYLVSSKIPAKWTTYKKTMKGILNNGFSSKSFKPGTKFFRVLCFIIGKKEKDCFSLIKDVQIKTKVSK